MSIRSWRMFAVLALMGAAGCGAEPPAVAESLRSQKAATSYTPMAFARVNITGTVVEQFNSAGGAATTSHVANSGLYTVSFPNLATGYNGHAQVSTEGSGTARCRLMSWGASGATQQVTVQCNLPSGAAADASFSVLYFRYTQAQSGFAAGSAYLWVNAGTAPSAYNFNPSGTLNTVSRYSTGSYTVTIPNASSTNVSWMVSAYGGSGAPFCQIGAWTASTNTTVSILCWNSAGAPADSDFALSYAVSGPTPQQQGAHAFFNGVTAPPAYTSWVSYAPGCTSVSVTPSLSGNQASFVVQGDIGSYDSNPLRRASFVSGQGGSAKSCRVISLTSSSTGGMTSTSTTRVQCQDASGTEVTPTFLFTHVTSEWSGPC